MRKIFSFIAVFFISGVLYAQPAVQIPYFDNFDGANLWTPISTGGTPWLLGAPGWAFPSTAHSAPNGWQIGLNAPYSNNSQSYLISPKFDFNNVNNATLSFWTNHNTELGWDGVRLDYSTDSISWTMLGSIGAPAAENWYNYNANCSNLPAWLSVSTQVPGNTNGWYKAAYELSAAGLNNVPEVWFRFHFCSDASVIDTGFVIDDFRIQPPAPIDAGIAAIDTFASSVVAGTCNDLYPVLKNFGSLAVTQTTIAYAINGLTVGSYNWSGSLAPGAQVVVPVPCYIAPMGNYTICAYTTTVNDSVFFNDTTCVDGFGIPFYAPDICHDFENDNGGFYTPYNPGYTNHWEYGTPAYGVTTGAHSGTKSWDINLDTPYGSNSHDTLYTPIYDVDPILHPVVSFWHNRKTSPNLDGYLMEYTIDNGVTWNSLGVYNDSLGINWFSRLSIPALNKSGWDGNSNGWKQSKYFLNSYITTTAQMQFRFVFGSGFGTFSQNDGVSIDDFCVSNSITVDAGVELLFPSTAGFLQQGVADSIGVRIRNHGISDLTATAIYYSVGGGATQGPYLWTGLLTAGTLSDTIFLSAFPFLTPPANFQICAWTTTLNDGNTSNDFTCRSLFGVPSFPITYANPYCNDFENGGGGWINENLGSTSLTNWELGTPQYGVTTGAHSGITAWDINLNTAYQNSANTALYSPVFQIPVNGTPILSFFQNRNTELNWDGVRLEYSINDGISWIILGSANTPATSGTNWYNQASLNCSLQPGWAGNPGGWVQSTYQALSFLGGQSVRFRFIFCSDAAVIMDGFTIDDFCVSLLAPVSAAPLTISINSAIPVYFPGQCYSFSALFGNSGTLNLNDLSASLFVDGVQVSSGFVSFNPGLVSGAISPAYTFPNCWVATPGIHNVCVVTGNPNGGMDYNIYDDSTCFTITIIGQENLTSGNSYCSNFESSQEFMAVHGISFSNVSSWKYGLPAKSFLSNAYSGSKAWVTNITQNYPANDNSALVSKIFILNTNSSYMVSFFSKFKTEFMNDGGTFQYSVDYGNTWSTIGDYLDPQWMNTQNIVAINPNPPPNISGWSGQDGWQQMQHLVCFPSFQGTVPIYVLFRFLFMSDIFDQDEGWEIDDFCLAPDPALCTVGLEDNMSNEGVFSTSNSPNPFHTSTDILFYIPAPGNVSIAVTDISGKEVAHPANGNYSAGMQSVNFTRKNLTPGIYFYSVSWRDKKINRKMLITE